jgi:acetylornithine deacetylase/succinyl-diaminopimelate desuccinylase-like protein
MLRKKYALRVVDPRPADRPAGGWPPSGRIIMSPQRPPNYYPFSVFPNHGTTYRFIFRNLWLFKSEIINRLTEAVEVAAQIRTTTALTVISGGIKDNVLPTKAKAWVNHRIHPR